MGLLLVSKVKKTRDFARFLPIYLGLLTLLAFLPALTADFVNWDDPAYVIANESLNWPWLQQIHHVFSTFYMGHYQPLSLLSLAIDHALWGFDPFGYHLTSLLLHMANGLLVYYLVLLLFAAAREEPSTRGTPSDGMRFAAFLAAAAFALHPMRVESVVWITERRDVLSAFFNLIALISYLRAANSENNRGSWLITAWISFAFGLLAKASGVPMLLVFPLLDLYPLSRFRRGETQRVLWMEKIPFALLALAAAAVAPLAQSATRAMVPWDQHGLFERGAVVVYGLVYYLWKSLWPQPLSPLYELPVPVDPLQWRFLLSAAACGLIIVGLWVLWRRRHPWSAPLLTVATAYTLLLSPVLGFLQSGPHLVADRYSYLPAVGLSLLFGVGFNQLRARLEKPRSRFGAHLLAILILASWMLTTWQYSRVWGNSLSLWEHALTVDDDCGFCREGEAHALFEAQKIDQAIAAYQTALKHRPNLLNSHLALATLLPTRGQANAAIDHYYHALRIDPGNRGARGRLADLLLSQKRWAEAETVLLQLLQANPEDPQLQEGLKKARRGLERTGSLG